MMMEKDCRMLSPTNDVRIAVAGVKSVKKDFAEFFSTTL